MGDAERAVFAEVNGGGADGGEESSGELAGVEGLLGERGDGAVGRVLEGSFSLYRDGEAGEGFDALQEGWVESDAELREREQGGWVVGVVGGEHPGGGGGGVGERGVAFEDGDAGATGVEFEGEREADDAGPGDEDVWRVLWVLVGGDFGHRPSNYPLTGIPNAGCCVSLSGFAGFDGLQRRGRMCRVPICVQSQ